MATRKKAARKTTRRKNPATAQQKFANGEWVNCKAVRQRVVNGRKVTEIKK